MADTVAVMNAGRHRADGRARRPLREPRTTFVANFLGQSNLIEGEVTAPRRRRRRRRHARDRRLASPRAARTPTAARAGRDPARRRCSSASEGEALYAPGNSVPGGEVGDVSFIGVSTQYFVRMPLGPGAPGLRAEHRAPPALRQGERVELRGDPEHAFLLDAAQDASAGAGVDAARRRPPWPPSPRPKRHRRARPRRAARRGRARPVLAAAARAPVAAARLLHPLPMLYQPFDPTGSLRTGVRSPSSGADLLGRAAASTGRSSCGPWSTPPPPRCCACCSATRWRTRSPSRPAAGRTCCWSW